MRTDSGHGTDILYFDIQYIYSAHHIHVVFYNGGSNGVLDIVMQNSSVTAINVLGDKSRMKVYRNGTKLAVTSTNTNTQLIASFINWRVLADSQFGIYAPGDFDLTDYTEVTIP